MNIYFARHGQTDWNTLGKVQGTTNIALNETGLRQAAQLCEYFAERGIVLDKIYTSHQTRALQTAQIVSERFGLSYETVPGLEEMNMGLFEGHTWAETEALYPEELKNWNINKRYSRTPGGESYQMVMERLFAALDRIIGQHDADSDKDRINCDADSDKNLLVVTHGGVIMPLIALNEGIPFEVSHLRIAVPNAEPLMFTTEELAKIRRKL